MLVKEDSFIKNISDLRKIIKKEIQQPIEYVEVEKGDFRNKLNIVTDALVYLTMKHSKSPDEIDKVSNPILKEIMQENSCRRLIENICQRKLTFQNVIDKTANSLNLPKKDFYDVDKIIAHPDLKDKPDIRAALKMYLLKGNFSWVSDSYSEFGQFVRDDNKDSLSYDARINCWEAVFYGLMKADTLPRDVVKDYYKGHMFQTEDKIGKWIDFEHSTQISKGKEHHNNWRNLMQEKPYFIAMDRGSYGNGLAHDMLSFPYSQKQLLKMLITQKFDEKPTKTKLFSHWINWTGGSVGSVTKKDFQKKLEDTGTRTGIVPLNKFIEKGKELSSKETLSR